MGGVNWGILGSTPMQKPLNVGQMVADVQSKRADTGLAQSQTGLTQSQTATLQEKLKTLPQELQLGLQKTQAEIGQTKASTGMIGSETRLNLAKLSDQQLTNKKNQLEFINYGAGGLLNLPEEDRPTGYNAWIGKLKKMGLDTSDMPQKYSDNPIAADRAIRNAYMQSAWGAEQFKGAVDAKKSALTQKLYAVKNPQTGNTEYLPTSMAAGMTPATAEKETAFQSEMGKKSADTFNATSDAADKASVIKQDLQTMAGFANKMPSELGVIKGRMLNFTSQGQQVLAANQKLVLDMFSQMPHIGRSGNLLLNTIQQSKVPATMDINDYIKRANLLYAGANYVTQRNQFNQYLIENGVTNEPKAQAIWDKFEDKHPIMDTKTGKINTESPGMWRSFLQNNPNLLGKESLLTPMGEEPKGAIQATKIVNGTNYHQINGKWYQ